MVTLLRRPPRTDVGEDRAHVVVEFAGDSRHRLDLGGQARAIRQPLERDRHQLAVAVVPRVPLRVVGRRDVRDVPAGGATVAVHAVGLVELLATGHLRLRTGLLARDRAAGHGGDHEDDGEPGNDGSNARRMPHPSCPRTGAPSHSSIPARRPSTASTRAPAHMAFPTEAT